jgi:hypothetical protein
MEPNIEIKIPLAFQKRLASDVKNNWMIILNADRALKI